MSGERNFKRRYLDARSSQGKRLKEIMENLTAELGGDGALGAGQRLILAQVRLKLATIHAIEDHMERVGSLVAPDGEPIAPVRKSYLAFTRDLRRDIETLFSLGGRKKKPAMVLADYLRSRAAGQPEAAP